jgi:midasin (ATPase involved in ribosome maturation)
MVSCVTLTRVWACLVITRAGANVGWFHLFRLLIRDGVEPSATELGSASTTIEQFIQTSTAGEFAARMEMLDAFRFQLLLQAGGRGAGCWAARLASVLGNMSTYYRQFQSAVEERLQMGRQPLDKDLADFVKLAKWEDRGYYAMKQVGTASTAPSQYFLCFVAAQSDYPSSLSFEFRCTCQL